MQQELIERALRGDWLHRHRGFCEVPPTMEGRMHSYVFDNVNHFSSRRAEVPVSMHGNRHGCGTGSKLPRPAAGTKA